jgi:hypothetical protein
MSNGGCPDRRENGGVRFGILGLVRRGRRGLRDQRRPALSRPARPPGRAEGASRILEQTLPSARPLPVVSVLDGHPHTLAFLATINQVPGSTLGDTYRHHGIDADGIVGACLDLVQRA